MSLHPDIAAVLAGDSEGCIIHGDCLEIMADMPDGCVDAVVTDPPYGIGEARNNNASRSAIAVSRDYGCASWDDERKVAEVVEAVRISGEQVVFGGNYYADVLPASPSWIVWDKDNGANDFADCELAWSSHKRAVRKVRWRWHGMRQEPGAPRDKRVHPTQKPLGLMAWVLENYTNPADIILDPFCGSGTTCVAAKRLGRRYIGIDIEPKYADIARERIAKEEWSQDRQRKSWLTQKPKKKRRKGLIG